MRERVCVCVCMHMCMHVFIVCMYTVVQFGVFIVAFFLYRRASLRPASTDDRSAPILTFSISSQSSSMSTTPPDSAHIHSVVTMATAQATELPASSDTLAETRKNPDANHLKDEVFEDLEAEAQELRTITRQVAASVITDYADSSEHKEKSDGANDEGTSERGSQLLSPPTSGTGLDLSGSDEWMVL